MLRVYQLARRLDKPHRGLLQLLRELGYNVQSHMATLSEEEETQLREAVDRQERGAPAVRPVHTTSESVRADHVAAVVGQIDLQEEKVSAADRAKAGRLGSRAPVRTAKKKEPGRRRPLDRDQLAEEYAIEAEREGLEMVGEDVGEVLGPALPPGGVTSEVVRTIDLSQFKEPVRKTEPPPAPTGAPPRRRRTGGYRGPRTLQRQKRRGPKVSIQASQQLTVTVPISLKDLSQVFGVRANDLIRYCMSELKDFSTSMNSVLDADRVELLADAFERDVTITTAKAAEDRLEDTLIEQDSKAEGEPEPRPPVVAILGHVDHGKTSLLDKIRDSNVVEGEHGGITQHIGAFQVALDDGHKITFLDTPGHAAFTAMRARGAKAADIVVLVVAADDGVMPQTEEAINHSKAAEVPIVVAVNKIDKADANPMKVKQELVAHGITPEDWGGEAQVCDVSAITGDGIDSLLEALALQAEIGELTANPRAMAKGRVIEARKDPNRGVVCTLLVEEGTLKRGDTVVAGLGMGRVRTMSDDRGQAVQAAEPSRPVEVFGLSEVPEAGEPFYVVKSLRVAKNVIAERQVKTKELATPERKQISLANLFGSEGERETNEVQIILKADVRGSLEPLKAEIAKLEHPEVELKLLYGGLGAITRSDVDTAIASNAVIFGFHVTTEPAARKIAERNGVEIRQYTVIYKLIDDIRAAMENMLAPDEIEEITGHVEVRQIFASSRLGNIAGSYVTDGVIRRDGFARVYRQGRLIYGGERRVPVASLRRVKDDVKEVREGFECGVRVTDFNDVKEGDTIEFYEVKRVKRTLEDGKKEAAKKGD